MNEHLELLLADDKLQIQKGLEGLSTTLHQTDGEQFEEAVHAIIHLFHIDPMDHPELLPVLDQAESVLADLRGKVIPVLIQSLEETDLKVHFHLAAILGRMGYSAVTPLIEAYRHGEDPYTRIFALYAAGKIRDRKVLEFLPILFEALEDPNNEVRDTAARTAGKICEQVDPSELDQSTRLDLYERLLAKVSDSFAGVRSKAIRSLGKMARYGLLNNEQRNLLNTMLKKVLGEDDVGNWDLAYPVRAEAQKARRML